MSDKPSPTGPRFDMSLSVFFPCYNEEGNIEPLARKATAVLSGMVRQWEIIIVDDGSKDNTGAIADGLAAADSRIRVVHHRVNKGYGSALRSGFAAARMDYVFYTDGDGQFDLSEIDRLLAIRESADIISGYRLKRQEGFRRKLNSTCWAWLVQRVLSFRCRDVDSAFKLYRRRIFDDFELKSTGALIDAEVLARATHAGYTIKTVGVSHLPRQSGNPTGAKLGVIFKAFKELLRLRKDIRAK